MSDLMMVAGVVVAVWLGLPLVLQVLAAILGPVLQALRSAASVLGNATHTTMSRACGLWMEGRTSVGEAIAFGVGSFYHMAVGTQIVWTDLVLAAATVAGLIGLPFSGTGFHYDLLLGVSAVFTALIFAETGANLMQWVRTMPFASVTRGRIFTFLLAGTGLFGSIALLGALAFYRSQMIAEDADPTTVSTWINYLPNWILVAMSSLFTLSAALAFTTIETLFVTTAGLVCACTAGVLGVITFLVRLVSLGVELLCNVVQAISAWWGERSMLSEAVSVIWNGLVNRLKGLVEVKPIQQAELIMPASSNTPSSPVKPARSVAEPGEVVLAPARVTDVDPEDRELVGLAASGKQGNDRSYEHRWEYPG